MKFIAKLRVWGNWGIGENVLKVFLRFRGSANRRVDLFLPLIASISGWRQCDASKCEMRRLGRVTPSAGRDVIDRKTCYLSLLAQAAVWLLELRVSQHFSTFYGSSVQAMDTQLGARHQRRTPTIHEYHSAGSELLTSRPSRQLTSLKRKRRLFENTYRSMPFACASGLLQETSPAS